MRGPCRELHFDLLGERERERERHSREVCRFVQAGYLFGTGSAGTVTDADYNWCLKDWVGSVWQCTLN